MAYFDGEHLRYQDGTIVDLPYESLREACLSYEGQQLRISSIIFLMLEKLLGEPIRFRGKYKFYGKSELYCKLEKTIQSDERYLARKKAYLDV